MHTLTTNKRTTHAHTEIHTQHTHAEIHTPHAHTSTHMHTTHTHTQHQLLLLRRPSRAHTHRKTNRTGARQTLPRTSPIVEGAPSIRWYELPAINCLQLSVCHYQLNYGPWHCSKWVWNTCANWCVECWMIKKSEVNHPNKKREVNLKKVSQLSYYSLKILHFQHQKGPS